MNRCEDEMGQFLPVDSDDDDGSFSDDYSDEFEEEDFF